MVAEASNATSALEGARAEPRGRLRVTIAVGLARHVLPVLAKLGAENPRLELDLRVGDRYASLLDEDLDLAVRGGTLEDSTLIARQLTPVAYVLCAAPDYLRRYGVPAAPAELGRHLLPKVRAASDGLAALLARSSWDRIDPHWVASRRTSRC